MVKTIEAFTDSKGDLHHSYEAAREADKISFISILLLKEDANEDEIITADAIWRNRKALVSLLVE